MTLSMKLMTQSRYIRGVDFCGYVYYSDEPYSWKFICHSTASAQQRCPSEWRHEFRVIYTDQLLSLVLLSTSIFTLPTFIPFFSQYKLIKLWLCKEHTSVFKEMVIIDAMKYTSLNMSVLCFWWFFTTFMTSRSSDDVATAIVSISSLMVMIHATNFIVLSLIMLYWRFIHIHTMVDVRAHITNTTPNIITTLNDSNSIVVGIPLSPMVPTVMAQRV